MQTYQLIYLVALVCIILEIFTTSFFLLGVGFGLIAVAMTQQLLGTTNYTRDLLIFMTITIVSFYIFRIVFKGKKDVDIIDNDINQY